MVTPTLSHPLKHGLNVHVEGLNERYFQEKTHQNLVNSLPVKHTPGSSPDTCHSL